MNAIFSIIPGASDAASDSSKVFTFVDICGGPGGFVEFVLTACKARKVSCAGYGVTLRSAEPSCDWGLHDVSALTGMFLYPCVASGSACC